MKKLTILAIFSLVILGCNPQKKIASLHINHPKILLEYCIENYNPEVKEIIRDSIAYIETVDTLIRCDSLDTVVIVKQPKEKIVYRETIKEVKDTREIKLKQLQLDSLNAYYKEEFDKINKELSNKELSLTKSKGKIASKNKTIIYLISSLVLLVSIIGLRIYLKLKTKLI